MNKKIMYSLIFTSVFILSTAVVFFQPVSAAKWSFGVPEQAKGLKLQSEVKAYDKDSWIEHLGDNKDSSVANKHGVYRDGDTQDVDNVGAFSQSEISDWEKDDYWFMGDTLLYAKLDWSIRNNPTYDRNGDGVSDLIYYWDAIPFARNTLLGLSGNPAIAPTSAYYKPLIYGMWSVVDGTRANGYGALVTDSISGAINMTEGLGTGGVPTGTGVWESTLSREEFSATFAKTYKAVVVERDVWYWEKNADFKTKPDEEDSKTPFIESPEDLADSWFNFVGSTNFIFDQVEAIINYLNMFMIQVNFSTASDPYNIFAPNFAADKSTTVPNSAWYFLNATIGGASTPALAGLKAGIDATFATNPYSFPNVGDYPFMWYFLMYGGLKTSLLDFFRNKIPDRAEYLIMLLRSGIPAHQPVDSWLEKMVDEFNIDDKYAYGGTDDQFYCDVSVDGMVVTVEIDWVDGITISDDLTIPAKDNERAGYEMVFTYSDTGGQSSMVYQDGDDIFFKTESIAPAIPGYEVTIILGAGAISAMGLIYVIMKKRRM
jgi:hypothetical protein